MFFYSRTDIVTIRKVITFSKMELFLQQIEMNNFQYNVEI